MTMAEGPPDGVERRQTRVDLSQVMEDVASLERSVVSLAGSVTKIVPDQIQLGVGEIRKLFLQLAAVIAAATVIGLVVVMWWINTGVGRVNHRIDEGHDVIACILRIPEATRTDVTVLTCRQVAKEK